MPELLYKNAREVFRLFKVAFEGDITLQKEFLDAISRLLTEYNTTIYENRFVVGGAIEYILVAAFNALDSVRAKHIGKFNDRLDIEAGKKDDREKTAHYSIKGVFASPGDIRLINVLGEGGNAEWKEPTIFVLAGIGIVYADYLILPEATRKTGDALVLVRQSFRKYLEARSEFLIDIKIPHKSGERDLSESKTASEDVARVLLRKYKKLRLDD